MHLKDFIFSSFVLCA